MHRSCKNNYTLNIFYKNPLLKSKNLICNFLMLKIMCYHDTCRVFEFIHKHLHNHSICIGINRFCSFVKDNNLRIAEKSTRNSNSLSLSTRKFESSITDICLKSFRKALNKISESDFLYNLKKSLFADFFIVPI